MRPSASASSISLMKIPLPSAGGAKEARSSRSAAGCRLRLLQAVAGGADDLDLDGVAGGAQGGGDVVGLPERELGAA